MLLPEGGVETRDWGWDRVRLVRSYLQSISLERLHMAIQSFVFHRPDNDVVFETFCLKVFRVYREIPNLQKFGRRGQRQFGIDLIGNVSGRGLGIQCKLRNVDKEFSETDVDAAVELAKTFDPPLSEFIIATTADREPPVQAHVTRLNQAHHAAGLFEVAVYAWQDIEEILKQDPDLAAELYSTPSPTATMNVASYTTVNYQAIAGDAHAEIDEAARNITEGNADVALVLLKRLQNNRWDVLTPRERFRVLANIGNASLLKGDKLSAARAFLEAVTHQSQDDAEVLSIGAHGQLLSGNTEQAYALASTACSLNAMNERAQIIRVESAPEEVSFAELRDSMPGVLKSGMNIALALSEKAMKEGNPAEAERVLQGVTESSPSVQFALGAALLQQGLPTGGQEGLFLIAHDIEQVRRAYGLFTEAIDSSDAPSDLVAASHFNRALASLFLGDEDEAYEDFRLAYENKPDEEAFGLAFIAESLRRGKPVDVLNAARQAFQKHQTPKTRFLLSMALYDSGGDEEKQQALSLLQDGLVTLERVEPGIRLEYLRRTLFLLQTSDTLSADSVDALLNSLSSPLERGIIKTWALYRRDLHDEAREEATRTVELLSETTTFELRREVALLLSRLKMEEEALPLWLEISPPRGFTEDTAHLLNSASVLGKDEVVLDYCERLRANGVYEPRAGEIEVELLVRYNELRSAKAVTKAYLDANPHNLTLHLYLLHMAVMQSWHEIVESYFKSYPAAREIETAEDGARLVQILNFKGLAKAATEFAYEFVRRFPDSPHSHRSLIISVLSLGGPKEDLDLGAPPRVVVGSAVRLRKEGEESSQWVVIEDSEKPELSRDEYPPSHPLAKVLIGKTADEVVTLPGSSIRVQTAVVEEIKNKVLFRMHQSMEHMNRRFPEQAFFEAIPVGPFSEESPTGHEFDELLEVNRRLAQGPMLAEEFYDERRLPVAALASVAGREIPEVVEALARDGRRTVHCVAGTSQELQRARAVLGNAREIVLDLTSLCTISLIDLDLSWMAAKCIVSEGSLESLRRLAKSRLEDERVKGYLGLNGDRLTIRDIDPDVERERTHKASEFVERIASLCEVVGGRALARMDTESRKKLLGIFGEETAESIAIAQERGCPLWTDDYATGVVAQSEFSIARAWTQAVCFWLRDAEIITSEELDILTARLCEFNYKFTSISSRTIVTACRLSEWNPDRQPLSGVLDRLGELGMDQDILPMTSSLIPLLWREAPLRDSAVPVTLRILDKLGPNRRGREAIGVIWEKLDTLFGVNVIGAEEARRVIGAWLHASRRGGRIIES